MINNFIQRVNRNLQQKGYLTDCRPLIPGVRGLLYAHTVKPERMAFAKVYGHFLFVDWENDLFGRLDVLLETHKKFSAFVNKGFKVPRAWRMTIPNLVTAAVSESEFPKEAVEYAQNRYLNPLIGGETGQLMLIQLPEKRLIHHPRPYLMGKQTGSIPLMQAVYLFQEVIQGEK